MAVKVIQRKALPPKNIGCKNCGAMLEYYPIDVKCYSGTDIGGGPDGCEWVDCPECQSRVNIRSW